MRSSFLVVVSGIALACGPAGPARSPAAVPAAVGELAAETCGQFEVVVDKGKDSVHAVTDLRARCDNSYVCAPRVASNRVEMLALAPGSTTMHLEYTDPATGKAYADDVPVTVKPRAADERERFATRGCSYIPVRTRP